MRGGANAHRLASDFLWIPGRGGFDNGQVKILALYRQFPQYVLGCANCELAVFYPIACGVASSVFHRFSHYFDAQHELGLTRQQQADAARAAVQI